MSSAEQLCIIPRGRTSTGAAHTPRLLLTHLLTGAVQAHCQGPLIDAMNANGKTVNGVPVEDVIREYPEVPELVERIAFRKVPAPILAIEEYDPAWPEQFKVFEGRIRAAFDQSSSTDNSENKVTILAVNHVGSTSIPGLPAKAVIDIDLVLSSVKLPSEPYYVPFLEAAGFQYLLREPAWVSSIALGGWPPRKFRLAAARTPLLCSFRANLLQPSRLWTKLS